MLEKIESETESDIENPSENSNTEYIAEKLILDNKKKAINL